MGDFDGAALDLMRGAVERVVQEDTAVFVGTHAAVDHGQTGHSFVAMGGENWDDKENEKREPKAAMASQ